MRFQLQRRRRWQSGSDRIDEMRVKYLNSVESSDGNECVLTRCDGIKGGKSDDE